ncbi:MAG: hypothetical protein JHC71_05100, partial [Blastococcus sp.]|nr:hypothetical protein [Blastococcus sp.]
LTTDTVRRVAWNGEEVVLGVRVGSALCPVESDDVAELLALAGTGTTAVRR